MFEYQNDKFLAVAFKNENYFFAISKLEDENNNDNLKIKNVVTTYSFQSDNIENFEKIKNEIRSQISDKKIFNDNDYKSAEKKLDEFYKKLKQ